MFVSADRVKLRSQSLVLIGLLTLAACGSETVDGNMEPEDPPETTSSGFVENEGDNVTRATGTGTVAQVGFQNSLFPTSAGGVSAPNTTIGNPGAATPTGLTGVSTISAVQILTFDSSTGTIGSQAGVYNNTTEQVTTGGNSYNVASNGTAYTGNILSGGDALTVTSPTDPAVIPMGGGAAYSGTGDVVYVDGPSGQAFNGTMDASVTANFAGGTVAITMSNPDGEIGGRAYNDAGQIRITNLAINGNEYASNGTSTGRVTGFVGAADLNSGNQTVTARGLFGGATYDETSAIARIDDGANGEAILRLNASR
ncbi:hypothetical protein [Planktotalea sp.]|uniref:hypothetical protein n=1 Tax=Planktotalea sp. TaxID=2029877 RepID=UPI0032975434